MGARLFDDLTAYRLSAELADQMHSAIKSWSPFDRWTLGLQLLRAADSIGANIAEAAGRWHSADRRRLLIIARGSLSETEHWLLRAESRGLVICNEDLRPRLSELGRTLNGLDQRHGPSDSDF